MTTYYVNSNTGNDSNSGTSTTAPFDTLQAAANHTAPGDFVEVMNGTYTGPAGGVVVDITTSGTASAPITYEAAPGQTPIIDSSGTWHGIDIQASYINVSGFTVVGNSASYNLQQALALNAAGTALLNGDGIVVMGTDSFVPNHVTIENNIIHNEPSAGISSIGADYVQVLNNTVYNNANWSTYGASGISFWENVNSDTKAGIHDVISGNTVYNNAQLVPTQGGNIIYDGEGIIMDTNPGFVGQILIQNNIVHDNGSVGIETFHTDNVIIDSNAIWHNNLGHVQSSQYDGSGDSAVFINQSNNITVTNNTGDPGGPPPPPPPPPPGGQTINGTNGSDNLVGTSGNDTINAFSGNDRLDGAGGSDILSGGKGHDTFVFNAGEADGDSITDFHDSGRSSDQFEFHGYGNGSFTQVDATHWAIGYEGNAHPAEVIAVNGHVSAGDFHFLV